MILVDTAVGESVVVVVVVDAAAADSPWKQSSLPWRDSWRAAPWDGGNFAADIGIDMAKSLEGMSSEM